jgi:SAM-dependent methyltransferase
MSSVDPTLVEDFGKEWSKFDQSKELQGELQPLFETYFSVFPWASLPPSAVGFDLGCGSGRWARFVAPRVGRLHCIDPSSVALEVARRNLKEFSNCDFHCSSVEAIPLPDNSADFGYSLGVLHHIPDTQKGIAECVRKLKPGAPFLVYLYYAFDNRPWWFRVIWITSDGLRRFVCKLPFALKSLICELMAIFVYWPLARTAWLLEKLGADVDSFPLSAYRRRDIYLMRNDALDRFGTRLEQRFTRKEIKEMMQSAALERITFGDRPYWCAVGYRA